MSIHVSDEDAAAASTIHADNVTSSVDGYVTRFSRSPSRVADRRDASCCRVEDERALVQFQVADSAGVACRKDARQHADDEESRTRSKRHSDAVLSSAERSACEVRSTGSPHCTTSSRTRVRPVSRNPSASAAARERSMMTPLVRTARTGPLSTIRTLTDRSLRRFVTRTTVPNGYVGCAATSASLSNRTPLAVLFPSKLRA